VIRRYGQTLLAEGLFSDTAELECCAADLSTLAANEQRRDIAWGRGFGDDIMKQNVRQTELSN
jgi:GMP synthase (glutamine-hydrolysing)